MVKIIGKKIFLFLFLGMFLISFVSADIMVYKYHKPILELSLKEGGNLTADTNYYMTGVFIYSNQRDNGVQSPAADKVNITTNSTHKTINVEFFTNGSITGFSDAGGGKVNVVSYDHGLYTGDVVEISGTTNYDGTYTITWVDYDTFQITATYVSNETGTWKSYSIPSNAQYVQLYVNASDIQDANGNWIKDQNWWSGFYYGNGYTTNNITYNTLLTNSSSNRYHPELSTQLDDYIPSDFSKTEGRLMVSLTSGATYDLNDIATELKKSHSEDVYSISNSSFSILGNLVGSSDSSFEDSFVSLYIIGIYQGSGTGWVLNDSQVYLVGVRRASLKGTFNRCALQGITEMQLSGAHLTNSYIDSTSVINSLDNIAYSKEGITVTTHSGYHTWVVYPNLNAGTWKNINHINGYLYMSESHDFDDTYPNNTYEDLTFTDVVGSFDIYAYIYSGGRENIRFYNAVSNREGGIGVKIYSQKANGTSLLFYYKLNLTITDQDGNPISNADVKITDSKGTEYTSTTDTNGKASIWLKSFDFHALYRTYLITQTPTNNYNNFTLTISKTGYQDYNTPVYIDQQKDWTIALSPPSGGGGTVICDSVDLACSTGTRLISSKEYPYLNYKISPESDTTKGLLLNPYIIKTK